MEAAAEETDEANIESPESPDLIEEFDSRSPSRSSGVISTPGYYSNAGSRSSSVSSSPLFDFEPTRALFLPETLRARRRDLDVLRGSNRITPTAVNNNDSNVPLWTSAPIDGERRPGRFANLRAVDPPIRRRSSRRLSPGIPISSTRGATRSRPARISQDDEGDSVEPRKKMRTPLNFCFDDENEAEHEKSLAEAKKKATEKAQLEAELRDAIRRARIATAIAGGIWFPPRTTPCPKSLQRDTSKRVVPTAEEDEDDY